MTRWERWVLVGMIVGGILLPFGVAHATEYENGGPRGGGKDIAVGLGVGVGLADGGTASSSSGGSTASADVDLEDKRDAPMAYATESDSGVSTPWGGVSISSDAKRMRDTAVALLQAAGYVRDQQLRGELERRAVSLLMGAADRVDPNRGLVHKYLLRHVEDQVTRPAASLVRSIIP